MNESAKKITNYYIPGSNKELYWAIHDNEEDDKDSNEIDDDANESDHFRLIGIFDWALQNDKYTNLLNEVGIAELDADSLKIQLGVNSDDSIQSVDSFDANGVQLNKFQKRIFLITFIWEKVRIKFSKSIRSAKMIWNTPLGALVDRSK